MSETLETISARLEKLRARKALFEASIARTEQEGLGDYPCNTPLVPMTLQQSREEGFATALPAPNGEWLGTLIAKAWGRRMNLLCFFENAVTGEIHRCMAFRRSDKRYTPSDKGIDFSEENNGGCLYLLETGLNGKGNSVWISATLIGDDSKEQSRPHVKLSLLTDTPE